MLGPRGELSAIHRPQPCASTMERPTTAWNIWFICWAGGPYTIITHGHDKLFVFSLVRTTSILLYAYLSCSRGLTLARPEFYSTYSPWFHRWSDVMSLRNEVCV